MTDQDNAFALLSALEKTALGIPEIADVLHRAKAGEISDTEALAEVTAIVQTHPEAAVALMQIAAGESAAPKDFTMTPTTKGLPRMNPLYEAALAERAQFDGDIPELRTGPLMPGMAPSVPVLTAARNPVAIGKSLEDAAKEMEGRIQDHEVNRLQLVEQALLKEGLPVVAKHGELVAKGQPDVAALVHGTQDTDLPEYQRGQVPKAVAVREQKGAALATLGVEESKPAAWKALSTTQGRRSAVPVIADLVQRMMSGHGFHLTIRDPEKTEDDPVASHLWSVRLSGAASTQPSFSFIDTAARVITAALKNQLGEDSPVKLYLEIEPLNELGDRQVGWAARLMR